VRRPRRYSPLVGVGDDEDGEEEDEVDKMVAVWAMCGLAREPEPRQPQDSRQKNLK
jgi:hypothetical protein